MRNYVAWVVFAVSIATVGTAYGSERRTQIQKYLAVSGIEAKLGSQFDSVFERAYSEYALRARGKVEEDDKRVIAKAQSQFDPAPLRERLISLYNEELTEDELQLAVSYYSIQPPADIRGDKDALVAWAENLNGKQRDTIERFRNSDLGKSLQGKIAKVTMLIMAEFLQRFITTTDIFSGVDAEHWRSFVGLCRDKYKAEDAMGIWLMCSFPPECPECEFYLAEVLRSNALFPRDLPRATVKYKAAAHAGIPGAQRMFGALIARDETASAAQAIEGLQWILLSAENGDVEASDLVKQMDARNPGHMAKARSTFPTFKVRIRPALRGGNAQQAVQGPTSPPSAGSRP